MNSTVLSIPLDRVRVADRLREVNPEKVAGMALSMADRGQLTPIEVAPIGTTGEYRLVFGAHRHAAAKAAGLTEILAVVFEGTADEERLREIDENLYRAELGPLDQANFLAERRAIWERLHGKVTRGGDRKSKGQRGPLIGPRGQLSFFRDLEENFGLPTRTVKRALNRRNNIPPALWHRLKNSPFAYKAGELDALAGHHTKPDLQAAIVDLLLDPEHPLKTVRAAVLQINGAAPVQDRTDDGYGGIQKAWKAATPDGQVRAADWLLKKNPWILEKALIVAKVIKR